MQPDQLTAQMEEVARLLAASQRVVALTGAGISVESGIPAFRGAQGLWDKYDPIQFASLQAFEADPGLVWGMLLEMDELVRQALPNPAHEALARLEALGRLQSVVTQNIDGLHQAAGNQNVIEFHGSGRRLRCHACGRLVSRLELDLDKLPPRCGCGGVVRPDVVLFGEEISERAALTAFALCQGCQVMLVVGTSALVAPASHLPLLAKAHGAQVVEINPEPTPLTGGVSDYSLRAGASQALPSLVEQVARLLEREAAQP